MYIWIRNTVRQRPATIIPPSYEIAPIFVRNTYVYLLCVYILPATAVQRSLTAVFFSSLAPAQDLKDLMRRVGDVTFADAHKDRQNEG